MLRVRRLEATDSTGVHAFETFDSHHAIRVNLFGFGSLVETFLRFPLFDTIYLNPLRLEDLLPHPREDRDKANQLWPQGKPCYLDRLL